MNANSWDCDVWKVGAGAGGPGVAAGAARPGLGDCRPPVLLLLVLRLRQATPGLRLRSLTCFSRAMIMSTALFKIPSLVIGLSDFWCELQIRPSSFNASLISRILTLSL